jgi:hypothetical protein
MDVTDRLVKMNDLSALRHPLSRSTQGFPPHKPSAVGQDEVQIRKGMVLHTVGEVAMKLRA